MDKKQWWQSRTIWANIIAGAVTVSGVFGLDLGLDAAAQAQIVAGIIVVVNVILRLVTTKPISGNGVKLSSIAAVLLVFTLAACAGSTETRATNALAIACDGYKTALDELVTLREAERLTLEQISRIDATNTLVRPLCGVDSVVDPENAVSHVRDALAILKSIKEVI